MDMRKRLGEILDAASAGERILIERDHRPLAYLISVEEAQRLDPDREELLARQAAAFERLRALAEEMRGKEYEPDDGLTDTASSRTVRRTVSGSSSHRISGSK